MRNIYILNNAPLSSGEIGGTQTYSYSLFNKLNERGLEPKYIGIGDSTDVISVSPKPLKDVSFIIKSLVKVRRVKDGVIFSQVPVFALPFALFPGHTRLVSVIHADNIKSIRRKRGWLMGNLFAFFEMIALTLSARIIAVSDDMKRVYSKRFPWLKKKITVIPVGVDISLFRPMEKDNVRQKFGLEPEDFVILYVGRLRKDKGVDVIIKAFGEVKKTLPNSKLIIVGKGKDERKYRKLANKIGGDIVFSGSIPHNIMPKMMNCADVLALASLYESGPLVVPEALACGVPCVSTDVGRVREFIRNKKCGRIVNRNGVSFSDALIDVAGMDDVGRACRNASVNFSFEKTVDETLKLYKSLVAREARQ